MFCRAIPYEGNEPYIFVSYCHADKAVIYPLIEQMSLDGYRVWYDVGNKPGLNWLLNIEEHLENCQAVIAFISKNSRDSNNCNKEIIYAMKCEKKIIPVLLEDTALPRGLRMQLVDLHYLERKNFPSDKELLKKCYDSEECNNCKNSSGSIPLRHDDPVRPQNTPSPNNISEFIGNLTLIDRKSNSAEPVKAPPVIDTVETEPEVNYDIPSITKEQVLPESEYRAKVETPVINQYDSEKTVILSNIGEDDTVNEQGADNVSGTNGCGHGADYDKTVMSVSRNLVILLHPAGQKAYKLKSPKITVGRSQIRCDVAIEGNDSISKVHAFIRQTKYKCYIEDAHSSNGTFINGEQIEPGEQIPLDNPAVFQLNDETLILLCGLIAKTFEKKSSISLLINSEATAVRIMDSDSLSLNRNNKWPDGTLSDPKVHRAGHALLIQRNDGVYLVDESPVRGNGTYLNGSRMRHGDVKKLFSGDRIRLGDTTLEFVSIEIPS